MKEKKRNKRLARPIAAFVVALSLIATVTLSCNDAVATKAQTSHIISSITKVREQQEKLNEQLSEVSEARLSAEEELTALTEQRLLLDQEYAYQQELVQTYQEQVETLQKELVSVQESELEQYKNLKTILRSMEESPQTSFWGVVFGASSVREVLSYLSMMSEVVRYIKAELEELADVREELADMRFEFQSLEAKYTNSLRELEEQEEEIEEHSELLKARIDELAAEQDSIREKLEYITPTVKLSASEKELLQPLTTGTITELLTLATNELMDAGLDETAVNNRIKMLSYGLSLVGNVPYFWGGRSYSPGWNDEWNSLKAIKHYGSESQPYGEYFPYGLDCGGFVFWCALTLYGQDSWNSPVEWMTSKGATGIYNGSFAVEWDEKLPGDLVVNTPITHIGFYLCTNEDGDALYLHCCGSYGVVVSTRDLCKFNKAATIFSDREGGLT